MRRLLRGSRGRAGGFLPLRLVDNDNEPVCGVSLVLVLVLVTTWEERLGLDAELVQRECRLFLVSRTERSQWDVSASAGARTTP